MWTQVSVLPLYRGRSEVVIKVYAHALTLKCFFVAPPKKKKKIVINEPLQRSCERATPVDVA